MSFIGTRYFTKKQEPEANDSRIFWMFSKCPKRSGTRGASFVISLRKHACDARCMHYTDMTNSLSSAEAPVSQHQWKKNTGAGALEGENGSTGNDGKREKTLPSVPRAMLSSLSPASARFCQACSQGATAGGLCGGESDKLNLTNQGTCVSLNIERSIELQNTFIFQQEDSLQTS